METWDAVTHLLWGFQNEPIHVSNLIKKMHMKHFIFLYSLKMNSPAVLTGQRKILLGRRQQDKDGETHREKTEIRWEFEISMISQTHIKFDTRVSIIYRATNFTLHFTKKGLIC